VCCFVAQLQRTAGTIADACKKADSPKI